MKNKNEMCHFATIANSIIIPAIVTAKLVGCSESAVKKVRSGFIGKTGKGKVCQKIVVADNLLQQVMKLGVEEVSRIINQQK